MPEGGQQPLRHMLAAVLSAAQTIGAPHGLEEAANFAKSFRRVEGKTPHNFRKRIKASGHLANGSTATASPVGLSLG